LRKKLWKKARSFPEKVCGGKGGQATTGFELLQPSEGGELLGFKRPPKTTTRGTMDALGKKRLGQGVGGKKRKRKKTSFLPGEEGGGSRKPILSSNPPRKKKKREETGIGGFGRRHRWV